MLWASQHEYKKNSPSGFSSTFSTAAFSLDSFFSEETKSNKTSYYHY